MRVSTMWWSLLVSIVTVVAGCSTASSPSACATETDQGLCDRLSRNCDLLTATDNCGSSRTVNCGDCTSPLVCGGGGTANLCASPVTDGDASTAPDGCSFACPTLSHWVTGTFTITYANPPLANSMPAVDGKFAPLVNETIEFVFSFAEGAMTKEPVANNQYSVDIILSQANLVYQGDTSGILDEYVQRAVDGSDGDVEFSYGATEEMSVYAAAPGQGGPLDFSISFSCATPALPVGADQYVVPGDVDCSDASIEIDQLATIGSGTNLGVLNNAIGSGSFSYH